MEPSPVEPILVKLAEPRIVGLRTIRLIPWLTLAIGFSAAAATVILYRNRVFAEGLALGTLLGWLNFRLLRRGVAAIVASGLLTAATSEGPETAPRPRVPVVAAVFRYALMGLSLYVIFEYLHVPLVSLAVGLCAAGVATLVASIWAILNPEE
jgi:hypothetical protein